MNSSKHDTAGFENISQPVPKGLSEAMLLRTIMKNNPLIKEAVWSTLRNQIRSLDLNLSEDVWQHLVIANVTELEDSKVHVIE